MKVALYARYSSDHQRDASIHDQFQVCRAFAEKQGWQVVEDIRITPSQAPHCCALEFRR